MSGLLGRPLAATVVLTLLMGLAVVASWTLFGARAVQAGPFPVLEKAWPRIYGFQALVVAAVTFLLVHRSRVPVRPTRLAALLAGGWLGELGVLTALGGSFVANEIDPGNAWWFWWWATGGPIQPVAAWSGGLLALRLQTR